MNVEAAQAVRSGRIVLEYSESVSVIAIESVLRSEPDEALIVLHDLRRPRLGKPLSGREPGKTDSCAVHCRRAQGLRIDACLRHFRGVFLHCCPTTIGNGSRCAYKWKKCDGEPRRR